MWTAVVAVTVLAALSGCSGSADDAASPRTSATPSATATAGPTAAADPTAALALLTRRALARTYERTVLADAPSGFWPLGDAELTRGGITLPDGPPTKVAGGKALLTSGPTLDGQPRRGSRFDGTWRLSTPLTTGFTEGEDWTIELWFRSAGCPSTYQRLAGTTTSADPKSGVAVLHYPEGGRTSCRVGAEVWEGTRFLGGCSGKRTPVAGTWHLYSVSRAGGRLTCARDGVVVNRAPIAKAGPTARRFGIGGTSTFFKDALVGDLADVAVYPKALPVERVKAHAQARKTSR